MSFYIPAEVAEKVNAGALPPGTGYYAVKITKFEDRGVKDRQGNYSYFIHLQFPDGSTTREIGSCPFNADGEMAPALTQMDEDTRNKKIGGMVAALKRVAYSAGITDEYMAEHGLNTDHLVDRTAYIAWLGRPDDVPQGAKVYGEVKAFIEKEAFDAYEAKGEVPSDTRDFPWRRGQARGQQGGDHGGSGERKMAPPPKRGGFPPPPRN